MDTKELSEKLLKLQDAKGKEQEQLHKQLDEELGPDELEVVFDDDHGYCIRITQYF